MTPAIHPTAIIDPTAELAGDVTVGPHTVIGPSVSIGAGTEIAAHVVVERCTRIGSSCYVGVGSVLGGDPQDRKYRGETTWLDIGNDTQIREYCTLNRGSAARGRTAVGNQCFLMTYVHVGHDCTIEDGVVLANAVQLAGHVHVEEHAAIGGSTPVHQFVRIGTHSFVGGGSRVPQDVPPFTRAAGNPLKLYGINTIGLTRCGVPDDTRAALKHAYRLLFNSRLRHEEAVDMLHREGAQPSEVERLIAFIARSERGVLV